LRAKHVPLQEKLKKSAVHKRKHVEEEDEDLLREENKEDVPEFALD
jgi:hypothetical protein